MRAQDEAEYAELVAALSARLFHTAYAVCRDRAAAEDAVQAALISAYLSWRRVRAADSPEAYLRRMVLNQLFSWRRRASWRAEEARAQIPDTGGTSHEDLVVDRDEVWQALAALPPRQRAVVVLRYYEDLSEAQIAEALGIRPGTVKSQTSAALAHLRRELHDEVYARGEDQP
jgi:RNA polymerase sigma-70 factor (sigma-E family)